MLIFENQTAEDFTILDFDEDNYSTDSETPDPEIHKWGDFFAKATKEAGKTSKKGVTFP